VLGPILFLLYTADVLLIAERHGFQAHSYADDTQLYFHCIPGTSCSDCVKRIVACIAEMEQWMSSNYLRLNTDKTQFIWLGTPVQLTKVDCDDICVGNTSIHLSTEVTCLGVKFDQNISFSAHVKHLAGKCFYQLRQLRTVRRSISTDAAKTLVHAFVICRVDYCNAVLANIPALHLQPLQSVLNAAARVITRKRKYDHVSADMRDVLHWLPVRQRTEYKLCGYVYRSLHKSAPSYIAAMCNPVSEVAGRQHLRSAAHGDVVVPSMRTKTYGLRSFSVAGPSLWNSLPASLHDTTLTLEQFSSRLKTELFRRATKNIS